ncbi:MAG TPA: tetratricopeptide repeat protein [Micropepsaceae bacterium]|nr:tetratricopeptide repeat protein [Micropepsaceae bacterium]
MRLATFRQFVLGTVFTAALAGCASEDPLKYGSPPEIMAQGSSVGVDLDTGLAQARAERHDKQLKLARETLARLMLVAPDNPEVLGEYGKTLIAEGRSGEALKFLERAAALDPGQWSFHSAIGVAYDLMDEHSEAQAAYERALSLKPGEPIVLSNNAMSHMELGDLDTAEKLLMEASQNGADPLIKQNLATIQDMKARTPHRSVPNEAALAPGSADAALQPSMEAILDVAPVVDATPLPDDAQAPMASPDSAPVEDESWVEDQATRGETIALDPAVTEPVKPQAKSVKTAKGKIAAKKATAAQSQASQEQSPPTQTASGK